MKESEIKNLLQQNTDIMVIDDLSPITSFDYGDDNLKWKIFDHIILDYRLGEVTEKVLVLSKGEDNVTIFMFYNNLDDRVPYHLTYFDHDKILLKHAGLGNTSEVIMRKVYDIIDLTGIIFNFILNHKAEGTHYEVSEIRERSLVGSTPNEREVIAETAVRIFTLKEYVEKISKGKSGLKYHNNGESWRVRGHRRVYKSGKVVFIKPYTKGRGSVKSKNYRIK